MIFLLKICSKSYSISKNSYDLVCIGQRAQKVSKIISSKNKYLSFKKLFISAETNDLEKEEDNNRLQKIIKSTSKTFQQKQNNVTVKLRNQIMNISPQRNTLVLNNNEEIKFKYLIFSGYQNQWRNASYFDGLKQALSTKFNSVFSDFNHNQINKSKLQELYSKTDSTIYFSVPLSRHFGYNNYFMIHLLESLKNLSKKENNTVERIKIKILCEGQKLMPFNDQVNSQIEKTLVQKGIQIIKNTSIQKIDTRKRQFVTTQGKHFDYGAFYQYLPLKTPEILQNSKIDPLDIDQNTLKSKQYPNIYILGNVVPTAYSNHSIKLMSQVIAKNILNSQLKVNEPSKYQGNSSIQFWTGVSKLKYFKTNYDKQNYTVLNENQHLAKIKAFCQGQ